MASGCRRRPASWASASEMRHMVSRIEVRHLRYFVAVAEELSFRQAAERLHMSQPPLSVAIRELERMVGVPLLVRDKRHVMLTVQGEELLGRARRLLAEVVELESGVLDPQRSIHGVIEVAVPLDTERVLIDRFRARYHRAGLGRQLAIRVRSTASQLRRLREGTQDIGR